MATVDNYKVNIEVVGDAALKTAQADIQGLEGTIGGLSNKLSNLATAGFAAFAALGASALSMADNMADLAAATGISVGKIYGLSTALEQSGGSFEGGSMMIGKFAKALDEAVGGSEKAQEAFGKLGVSTQELATMTDEQLFQAAIDGLAGMEDGFAKTALATQIFGKEAKNIDFDALAEGTRNAVDPQMEASLLQAAQFVDDLAAAFRNLQIMAVQAFGPIFQVVGKFIADAENMKTVIQVVGALLAAAFAARIVSAIIATVNAIRLLGAAIKAAGVAQAFLTGLTGVGLAVVAASAAAATAAYYALGKAMDSAGKAGAPVAVPAGGATPAAASGVNLRDVQTPKSAKVRTPKSGGDSSAAREAASAAKSAEATALRMREQAVAAKAVTQELVQQNAASNEMREIEISLMGTASEYGNLIKANAQARKTSAEEIRGLEAKIAEEQAKGKETNANVITELKIQIVEKQKQLDTSLRLNQAEYDRTIQLGLQKNQLQEQLAVIEHLGQLEALTDAQKYRDALARGKISKEEYDRQTSLFQLQKEYDIKREQQEKTLAKLKENTVNGVNLEADALKRTMDIDEARFELRKGQMKIEQDLTDRMRKSGLAGIRAALESAKAMSTPFVVAEQATMSLFSSVSSAIDTLFDKGKFKFSDFAKSIIADMAKIALKAAASNILTSIFGRLLGGGKASTFSPVTGSLGGPLTFAAAGGPVKKDMPNIVGEQGPELFVPNSNGRILTNASMNRNAGAGELMAPVVNNTYITNNINAIDSRSVAQMFVENRKSLLGASMMARKEMPYGS
jgi:lambda family phage tail tape measure protein